MIAEKEKESKFRNRYVGAWYSYDKQERYRVYETPSVDDISIFGSKHENHESYMKVILTIWLPLHPDFQVDHCNKYRFDSLDRKTTNGKYP